MEFWSLFAQKPAGSIIFNKQLFFLTQAAQFDVSINIFFISLLSSFFSSLLCLVLLRLEF